MSKKKKIAIHKMFPKGWADFKGLYSRFPFFWNTHEWRGDTLLIIPFIKHTCTDLRSYR